MRYTSRMWLRKFIFDVLEKILQSRGMKISMGSQKGENLEIRDQEFINYVINENLSMVGRKRLISLTEACNHVVLSGVKGDFVECGVWRGGASILATKIFEKHKDFRQVWLFDTFAGMTEPSAKDNKHGSTFDKTLEKYSQLDRGNTNEWCLASLAEVKNNFSKSLVPLSRVRFVKGDVRETLLNQSSLPEQISVLRLDTDFYDSTLIELEVLYPRLAKGGILLIDDYGTWEGCAKAVEDFFSRGKFARPLLIADSGQGRVGVKCE